MGQLERRHLVELGNALVRALTWVAADLTPDLARALSMYVSAIDQASGEPDAAGAPPRPLERGGAMCGTTPGSWWRVELWLPSEREQSLAVWFLVFGRRDALFAEIHLLTMVDNDAFEVSVESDRSPAHGADLFPGGSPELLKRIRRALPRGVRAEDPRDTLQALDALTLHPVVFIDPSWPEHALTDSAAAQLVEWLMRVQGSPYAQVPEVAADATEWWRRWAERMRTGGRVSRRRPARPDEDDDGGSELGRLQELRPSSDEPLALSDLYAIARRSVRPARAAGHRSYWKKSLRSHDNILLLEAARAAGISRATAYARLASGSRRVADFSDAPDPVAALTALLRAAAPAARTLAIERRSVTESLMELGWTTEAARRFERRLRRLEPEEQRRRITRAMRRRSARL